MVDRFHGIVILVDRIHGIVILTGFCMNLSHLSQFFMKDELYIYVHFFLLIIHIFLITHIGFKSQTHVLFLFPDNDLFCEQK